MILFAAFNTFKNDSKITPGRGLALRNDLWNPKNDHGNKTKSTLFSFFAEKKCHNFVK
jgi:hypothetical protein